MSKLDTLKSILVLGATVTQTSRTVDGKDSNNGLTGQELMVVGTSDHNVRLLRCTPKGTAELGEITISLEDGEAFQNVTDNSFETKVVREVEKDTKRTWITHYKVKQPKKKGQEVPEQVIREQEAEAEKVELAQAADATDPEGLETPTQKAAPRKK